MPKSKRKRRSNSKTGYIGVRITDGGDKYQARITVNGKEKGIGSYGTAVQAAKAYDKEAIKLGRPLSALNFPKKASVGYAPKQQKLRNDNTVGYRGVSKTRCLTKYYTQITIAGKVTPLGTYETAQEAAVAYDRAVLKANKSTTFLNFPDMVHNLDVEIKRKYKRSASGYRGVSKVKKSGKYLVQIYAGKAIRVGLFDTAIQAALAYAQAAIKAGKKKSVLNFPDGLPILTEGKQARIFPPHP